MTQPLLAQKTSLTWLPLTSFPHLTTRSSGVIGVDALTKLTTGLDMYDREEAKRHAKRQAIEALNQSGEY